MLGLQDISVELLSAHLWLVILAGLGLIALTWLLYRRTSPPLPWYTRAGLAALRLIAIVAVVLILAEPVISYVRSHQRDTRLAVLLDRSQSMGKVEQGKSRRTRLDSLLSSQAWEAIQNQAELDRWYFAGRAAEEPAKVDSTRTALGEVMYSIRQAQLERPADAWLLFSDGRSNAGRPARAVATELGQPVHTIDMAAPSSRFDVGLAEIDFNPVVFSGQPTEVKVRLSFSESEGKTIPIQLLQDGQVLDRHSLTTDVSTGMAEATMRYTPSSPGQAMMQVRVPSLEGEQSTANNRRNFAVKVLKSRLNVLLVSPQPDYEVGFLKRFMDQADRYEVELIVTGSKAGNLSGRFPDRGAELNRYDLVVLHDPDPAQLEPHAGIIQSYLRERGGAVWLMMGQTYASRPPAQWLTELLPVARSGRVGIQRGEYQPVPAEGQLFHPVLRLADDQSSIRAIWSELPPFRSVLPCEVTAAGATVLAWLTSRAGNAPRLPAMAFRRHGPGKVLVNTALPLWTWGFVKLGLGEDDVHYRRFLEGTLSWLTVSDDFDPVRVAPSRDIYTRGQTVRFDAHAYDLGYRPLSGVSGEVSLESDDGTSYETDLLASGEGHYVAEFEGLPAGSYEWRAELSKDGQRLKTEEGRLLIESFSLEEYDQRGDPAELSAIASNSGGRYYRFDDFNKVVSDLELRPVTVRAEGDYSLWGKSWLLILIILALGVEWLWRKVMQLI
jgi:hypothetical protein